GSFLFSGVAIEKPVAVLSGGERARLCLAGLLLGQSNVLVLDEPSNHLDVESVEALAQALGDYKGTILCTSHDRDFIERIATNVVEVRDGKVRHFPDNYENYLYRIRNEIADGLKADKAGGMKVKKSSGANDYKRAKKLKSVEKRIKKLESDKKSCEQALAHEASSHQKNESIEALADISKRLERAELEWLELQES
ncbi:MAG: ABC-F family ATP-binding cassette domain-containing protein, partial [Planctomycetes bacterium]|nr:ABC-F family ATP-binding cassette domain-containing protein [Planctomycetota bacterium]